ncbi:MAG: hypothetical protein V1753_04595 [Pseudomonadota bacterium]
MWLVAFLILTVFHYKGDGFAADESGAISTSGQADKIASMAALLESIRQIDVDIELNLNAFKKSFSSAEKAGLQSKLDELRLRKDNLKLSFMKIASGVDIAMLVPKSEEEQFS